MSFLSSLAQTLITAYGTDLSRVTVVFPNKRASLFLNEELTHLYDKPLWSPAYITISDLFRSMSSLEVADPIKLICDLHKSYVKCTGIEESLDHFYGWGQILLSDFDDVDKHLAPADKVFANLRDIREYDDISYLSQQQKDIIRKFFSNFNDSHNTELKQRFLSFWSHIYDIYLDFNARLASQGLAYEGSLYRQVIEKSLKIEVNAFLNQNEEHDLSLRKHSARGGTTSQDVFERKICSSPHCSSPQYRQYVFAGFNLLLPVEQALIQHFEAEDKACLIQDTDEETPKEISIISAPTDNIQARYVSTWLKENHRIEAGSKTAIVLADESLLQTVIHAIPPEVTKLNITTGYPLSQTTAATRVAPQDVHKPNGGQVSFFPKRPGSSFLLVRNVLGRKYLTPKSPLELEALYRLELILDRLQALIDSGDLQVSDATLRRLLTQIIATTTIPFHGEPIEGIQIMGVLETRNLDFDHVLLLSCNEGNLPKGINDTSFIPYSIRKAYNLTTADHKVDIYHNYFRRLLQRASDVTILYNNSTSDGKTSEMSQFMHQLLVESPQPQPVNKSPELIEVLRQRFSEKPLSPSALSLYLRCPLQFFYRYAAGLDEYKEEDPMDSRLFGTIFHKAAQLLYSTLTGGETSMDKKEEENIPFKNVLARRASSCGMFFKRDISSSSVESKVEIIRAVDQAIKLELFHLEDPMAPMPPLNGLQLINREVIIKYLHQLLEVDRQLAPFTILALEHPISIGIPSQCVREPERGQDLSLKKHSARGGTTSQDVFERKDLTAISIGGVVDRIDLISLPDGTERIRVVDYKTSSTRLKPLPDVAAIFDPANIKYHSDYYLQAILYACLLEEKAFLNQTEDSVVSFKKHSARGGTTSQDVFERNNTVSKKNVSPCLLFIQHAGTDNYDPTLILGKTPITDVTEIKDEFMHHLTNLITEIFDPNTPFLPTEERTRCKSCPFHALCQS